MALDGLKQLFRMVRLGLPLARVKPSDARTVADLVEEKAEARADHPFVLFEGRTVSYREFNATANRVAHHAESLGLMPGDVVALLMENRPEYLATWAGFSKVGVTTALINTNLSGPTLAHALDAADTRRIIVGAECLEAWQSLDPELRDNLDTWVWRDPATTTGTLTEGVGDLDTALAGQPTTNPDPVARAEVRFGDTHVLIYTSGTTGLPKAAKMSHLRFTTTGVGARIAGFDADDVMYCALPLYHSAGGAMATMCALHAGGTLALRRRFSASAFWDDVRKYDATVFQYIGEFCRYLLNQPARPDDGDHRLRFCIGNGLRPDIWPEFQKRFRIPRIVEFYGATEGNVALVNYEGKVGSVGKRPPVIIPAPKIVRFDVDREEHIRGEDGLCQECGPDEPGELVAEIPARSDTAAGRFEGYTSKEATDKKILRNVAAEGDAWFRTGDLLRMDADGYYYFVDRIGDTFRWKGENVSTQEVAEALAPFPGIAMCNVYGVELGADGRAGMAALLLDDPDAFDPAALHGHVTRALPAYARPVFVRLQRDLEVTGTLKLRKVELQREGYDLDAVSDALYVRDDGAGRYVPLTRELLSALEAGTLRV